MLSWFPDDEACPDYLDWVWSREGFICPHCVDACSWKMKAAFGDVKAAVGRFSTTSGTILANTRVPPAAWFRWVGNDCEQVRRYQHQGYNKLLIWGAIKPAPMMLHHFAQAIGSIWTELLRRWRGSS
jgi:hypothetical protein